MKYGLIGEKLGHSFSKTVHRRLFDYEYELKEIPPDKLDDFLRRADFKAINVTIPYKRAVIPYLDEIEETAARIGAVNTILNQGGRLIGFNTDLSGMQALLAKNGIVLRGKKVLILGSGGTSATAAVLAERLGAHAVVRVSRSEKPGFITYVQAAEQHRDAQVILNTTPCGMYPQIGETPISLDAFPRLEAVADAIYNPLCSALVVQAKEKGIRAVGGLYMLVAQAAFAAEKFTGIAVPGEKIDRIWREIEAEKKNAVLIGMPGSGKTTIGKLLAKDEGKRFLDTDEEIRAETGMAIPDIFRLRGETGFRAVEQGVIRRVAAEQSAVIATGGGAVLNRENIRLLKENGTVIWLDRPLETLAATADRPLSSSREQLEQRYRERYALYREAADIRIGAAGDIPKTLRAVKEAIEHENFGFERA